MRAWYFTAAKQICQKFPGLQSAASHQTTAALANGRQSLLQACKSQVPMPQTELALHSKAEFEQTWHMKLVTQLTHQHRQATVIESTSQQLLRHCCASAKQLPSASWGPHARGQQACAFRSLCQPFTAWTQHTAKTQRQPALLARLSAGRQQLANIHTAGLQMGHTAKQAAEALDPATVAKAHKLSIPVGVLAGVFGSFVGVGGGVLIVPLLTGACKGLPQRLVSGTSLVAVVSTALASSYTYLSHGVVDTGAALLISCCAVVTAPLGANLTTTLNPAALKKALGYFLVLVAFLVPLKSVLFHNRQSVAAATADHGPSAALSQSPASFTPVHTPSTTAIDQPNSTAASADAPTDKGHSKAVSPSNLWQSAQASWAKMSWPTAFMLGATGAAAGVASGLLGIGGGTIVTPLLAMLTPLTQAGVLGTSLLGMVAPSCVGLTQHARLGNVDWRMAAGLAAGTAVGSATGSQVAVNAPAGVLEGIFSVGMLFLGWRTLRGTRQALQKVAKTK